MKFSISARVILFFVLIAGLMGCGNKFIIIKDDVNISKYSKTKIATGFLVKRFFDQFIVYSRSGIVQDKDYSDSEKKELLNIIDNLSYADKKYIYFTMVYNMPFMSDELALKFSLRDANKQELIKDAYLIPIKIYEISQYGTAISYNYTWVIEISPPVDSQHIQPSQLPLTLNVLFPDQKERVYSINGI